ncbi:MAG: MarR family transcriptional regulator, partial [Cyclobacteriaceae bacterium]|nr:MarR family transcriptional regulator [Cyclobacteriaceae bacterium]
DKNSDVSRLIDRLLIKELVAKNQCPKDKRASDIAISESGLELLSKLDTAINKLDLQLIGLSDEDAVALSSLLDKSRS